MTRKLQRVVTEIDKIKELISEQQERLRTLEQERIQLENAEVVALFRKNKFTPDDLIAYAAARRESEQGDTRHSPLPENANDGGTPPGKENLLDEE